MLKLIKLEMKKFKFIGCIRGVLIANLVIIGVLILINFAEKYEGRDVFDNFKMAFSIADTMVRGTFIVFGAVLIAKLIIEEFKNKTITVLFMYPVNRKKLIIAKLFIVAAFVFFSVLLSNIFISFVLCVSDNIYDIIPENLTMDIVVNQLINLVISALYSSGMSLIPLYFGMRKKSVPATIVSSILIVSIVCSNNGGFSLASIIAIPISLAVIGVLIAYSSIKNIEHVDVSN